MWLHFDTMIRNGGGKRMRPFLYRYHGGTGTRRKNAEVPTFERGGFVGSPFPGTW